MASQESIAMDHEKPLLPPADPKELCNDGDPIKQAALEPILRSTTLTSATNLPVSTRYATAMAQRVAKQHPPGSDYANPEWWLPHMFSALGAIVDMNKEPVSTVVHVEYHAGEVYVEHEVAPRKSTYPTPEQLATAKPDPTAIGGDPKDLARHAKDKGFTGDICTSCGGVEMRRNGTCLLCTNCGSTTGCS